MSHAATIAAALAADVPVLVWGPPGCGKTAAVTAAAASAGAEICVLIGSTLDPAEVGGITCPDGTVIPPAWARRLRGALDAGRPAWLYLDELTCSPRDTRAAMLRLVCERQVGPLSLDGCRVIAAANPPDLAADGSVLDPATANRWLHVQWSLDPAAWRRGLLSGWDAVAGDGIPPMPAASDESLARARGLVAAWIAHRPGALHALPEDEAARGGAWPSPRTWEYAARVLAVLRDPTSEVAGLALRGLVGEAAAAEAVAWWIDIDLPDPEEVLAGRATLPTRHDRLIAALGAVVDVATAPHPDRVERLRRACSLIDVVGGDAGLRAAGALQRAAVAARCTTLDAEWLARWAARARGR